MIMNAYSPIYSGWPCASCAAIVCTQGGPFDAKPAMVAGISRIELAKIGGMTPEVLIFNGICVESPPNIRLPTWRLGYCTDRKSTRLNSSHLGISYAVF